MWIALRLAILVGLLAVVAPQIAPQSAVGAFFGAITSDVLGFCERQPVACETGERAALATAGFLADQIEALRGEAETLTSSDRTLRPAESDAPPPVQRTLAPQG